MAKGPCSIIIPVHNKAALTRQCLDSIFEAPPAVPFEVIVVDDASSDSTAAVLASYGDRVRSVTLKRNSGFATACNAGAAAATGPYLVFLNNDTIVTDGWLDALADYADAHPQASVVGSRLLYPDGTIQHAGVVFTVSGDPRHIYVGFPPEHPAVMKSRRFQVVTAACLLIRTEAFDEVEGFDTDYQNDLEDVDLCLRLGELGHEVHYCHTSVLQHLESASRALRFHEGRSVKLYRERWGAKVRGDELDYYLEDGLLDLLRYSPERVNLDGGRRHREAELLQIRSRQLLALLRETIRVASHAPDAAKANGRLLRSMKAGARRGSARARRGGTRRAARAQELAALRAALAASVGAHEPEPSADGEVAAAPRPAGYAGMVSEVADVVDAVTPEEGTVLVASKGDEKLVELAGRHGWHFPRAEDGRYRGYYPAGDDDAVAHLEELRAEGAEFLALPGTAFWWLEHYPGLAQVLTGRYRLVASTDGCKVFDLRDGAPAPPPVTEISPGDYAKLVARVRSVVERVVPPGAIVLSVSKGDEGLVDLPGRLGWHFPRAEDGRYRGYYPSDDDDAISDLEALREQGAEFLVLPATAFWWLDSYPGFSRVLLERHGIAAWAEDCIVFDLRRGRESEIGSAPPVRASAGDVTEVPGTKLGADEYARLVEQVRALVESTVRPGAIALVVSKGDEKLVDLPGRQGWHFPRAADGRYRGYYPANDEDAIAHLDELRSAGAEYLVIPSVALWWLDSYPTFAAHLRERYATSAYEHRTAIVFELGEPLEPSVIANLIPKNSSLAVSTNFKGDLAVLEGYDAVQLSAQNADEAIDRLEELVRQGVEFLVIPRSAFSWHEGHSAFGEYLRDHHRLVTRQRHACEIWELEPAREDRGEGEPEPGPGGLPAAGNGRSSGPEEPSGAHWAQAGFRLWLRRRGKRGTHV